MIERFDWVFLWDAISEEAMNTFCEHISQFTPRITRKATAVRAYDCVGKPDSAWLETFNVRDHFVVPVTRSEVKSLKVAAFDMDSTLIPIECIDRLAARMHAEAKVSAITERAMQGELDFAQSLKARVACLAGMPRCEIDDVIASELTLMPGAEKLMTFLTAFGVKTYILSGGFVQFASHVQAKLNMTGAICNTLEPAFGDLNGQVSGPAGGVILDADGKRRALEVLTACAGAHLNQTLVAGDGANDLQMIRAAGLGVAYHAKPKVRNAAPIALNGGDLSDLILLFRESWQL